MRHPPEKVSLQPLSTHFGLKVISTLMNEAFSRRESQSFLCKRKVNPVWHASDYTLLPSSLGLWVLTLLGLGCLNVCVWYMFMFNVSVCLAWVGVFDACMCPELFVTRKAAPVGKKKAGDGEAREAVAASRGQGKGDSVIHWKLPVRFR